MDDPDELALQCVQLLRYAETKAAWEAAKTSEARDALSDHPWIDLVEQVAMEKQHARLHPGGDVEGCSGCLEASPA